MARKADPIGSVSRQDIGRRINELVKRWGKDTGLKISKDLPELLGHTPPTVWRWREGVDLTLEALVKVVEVFGARYGVTLDWLVFGTQPTAMSRIPLPRETLERRNAVLARLDKLLTEPEMLAFFEFGVNLAEAAAIIRGAPLFCEGHLLATGPAAQGANIARSILGFGSDPRRLRPGIPARKGKISVRVLSRRSLAADIVVGRRPLSAAEEFRF